MARKGEVAESVLKIKKINGVKPGRTPALRVRKDSKWVDTRKLKKSG